MRSRIDKGSNFEQRVFNIIKEIHKSIIDNPTKPLYHKKGDIYKICASTLVKTNVIHNSSNSYSVPRWEWNNNVPVNNKLANKTATIIRENRRKYYSASKAAKMEIDGIVANNSDSVMCSSQTEAPKFSEPTISVFTDQELWEELKSRNYAIKDNRICKTEVKYLD